ncbi:MAG TPA: SxtJ family membrane protein [Sumerlaeia bacterium]|nr:SxtJ family membrane protein [Sumerlaeia bacterium]
MLRIAAAEGIGMLVKINWKPDRKELRKFGVVMMAAFPVIGALLAWRAFHSAAPFWVCLGIGLVFLLSSFLSPPLGRVLYRGWMALAFALGAVVSPVVLGAVYFLILTPIGLILRLCGRDPLQLRKGSRPSFWREIRHRTETSDYERQF